MKLKRLFSLIMAAAMGLALVGCGGAYAQDNAPSALSANAAPAFDPDPEPESLPFFASLFKSKGDDAQDGGGAPAPIAGEVAKAAYPAAPAYPKEEDYTDEAGNFDSDAYFKAYQAWREAADARPSVTPEGRTPARP